MIHAREPVSEGCFCFVLRVCAHSVNMGCFVSKFELKPFRTEWEQSVTCELISLHSNAFSSCWKGGHNSCH